MNYQIEHSIHLEFFQKENSGSLRLWVPTPRGAKVEYTTPPNSSKELPNLGCTINYWEGLPVENLIITNTYTHTGVPRTPPLSFDFIARAKAEKDPLSEISGKIRDLPLFGEIKALNDSEKIKSIKDFILSFIKYEYPPQTRVAEEVLEVGKSDCGGYHALFVALSRSIGIPAVLDFGFRAKTNQPHVWAWWYDARGKSWQMEDLNDEQNKRKPTDRVSLVLSTNPKLDPPYPSSVLFLQSRLIWIENLEKLKEQGFSFRHYPNWKVD